MKLNFCKNTKAMIVISLLCFFNLKVLAQNFNVDKVETTEIIHPPSSSRDNIICKLSDSEFLKFHFNNDTGEEDVYWSLVNGELKTKAKGVLQNIFYKDEVYYGNHINDVVCINSEIYLSLGKRIILLTFEQNELIVVKEIKFESKIIQLISDYDKLTTILLPKRDKNKITSEIIALDPNLEIRENYFFTNPELCANQLSFRPFFLLNSKLYFIGAFSGTVIDVQNNVCQKHLFLDNSLSEKTIKSLAKSYGKGNALLTLFNKEFSQSQKSIQIVYRLAVDHETNKVYFNILNPEFNFKMIVYQAQTNDIKEILPFTQIKYFYSTETLETENLITNNEILPLFSLGDIIISNNNYVFVFDGIDQSPLPQEKEFLLQELKQNYKEGKYSTYMLTGQFLQ